MRIEYHPILAEELAEIRDFYEGRSDGLGAQFVDEFERQVLAISEMPTRWMVVRDDIRRALLRRFPCEILFRITVGNHEKRHPWFGLARR